MVFEHAAAAWFMVCLLTDTAPFAEHLGRLTRIEFQTGDAYRPLDDILLHLNSRAGERRCALSIRSNRQITESRVPDDFVAAVWRLALEPAETGFRLEQDQAGLMTAPLGAGVADAMHALLRAAEKQDAARSISTAKGKMQSGLLKSFACPSELAARHKPARDTLRRVLRSVVHDEFDFERQNSKSLKNAINLCRSALVSGDPSEAKSLWDVLYTLAAQLSPNEGVLPRSGLLNRLRAHFALRALPHYEADWKRLSEATRTEVASIRDTVGNSLRLPRDPELARLATANQRFVALHGEPGVGKTVVAKWWVKRLPATVRYWWLNAGALDTSSFDAFVQTLGVRNNLRDLLGETPDAQAWLVVDGLDTAFDPRVFRHLTQLLLSLPDCWHVLLTCQTEHWERIRDLLEEANAAANWLVIEISTPPVSDDVLGRFKNLQSLLQQPRLRALITRPRYLDSLARRFEPSSFNREWVGESDLLAWFWRKEIETPPHGCARAEVAKKLAGLLGDLLRADVPADEFSPTEHEHLDTLIAENICRRRNERITFTHDRIGDWARQRVLLGRMDELAEVLAHRLESPPWMVALRLLGIHLLEQDADLGRWRILFQQLGSLPRGERAQDALLEAAVFAEQSDLLLERIWPDLVADKGRLLVRLLNRFGHLGTIPIPIVKLLPIEQQVHLQSLRHRVPIAHHWPALLRVLHSHRERVVEFAFNIAAQLAACWLENGPVAGEARREAAELGLAVGRLALGWTRQERFYLERQAGVPLFRAALLAASDLPDEVAVFARDAAYRLPKQLSTRCYVEVTVNFGVGYSGYYPPPWLDGPAQPLNEGFQGAVLDGDTLGPLMTARPDAAQEVLLAALITPPRKPDPRLRDDTFFQDKLCLDEGSDFSLPHPFRGPFLSLLHRNAEATIEAIARLTNFASEQWQETPRAQHAAPRAVIVSFGARERILIGDYHVFLWYRFGGVCPHALSAALMALEWWFTERVLIGEGYESAAEKLLAFTNNVAIAGLLCAVGCQKPELFAGVLSPLATAPEFHNWEMTRRTMPDLASQMFSSTPQEKMLRSWSERPHRQRGLDEIAFELFRTREDFRQFMEPVTVRWEERAASDPSPHFKFLVEQMAPRFRRANYRGFEASAPLEYVPPADLVQRNAERQRQSDDFYLPHHFPLQCRSILRSGRPMPEEHLEVFWQVLQQVDAFDNISEDDSGVIRKETSYCAATAVLFTFHRDWLTRHPERERWLIERLSACILNPPVAALMDDDRDISGLDWSAYAALAVPVLWHEAPEDPARRRLVAKLATYRKYTTVELLCSIAASRRDKLGEHFIELLEFVCDWAIERQCAESPTHDEEANDPKPWLEQQGEDFVGRSRPRKVVPWENLSVELEPPLAWLPNSPRSMRYTFDVELWQAAFAWVPRLRSISGCPENGWLVGFWKHHLGLALQRLNAEPRDASTQESIPYNTEHWLLERVAQVVLDLPDAESRAAFWQPILSTAPHGAHWIEVFAAALLSSAGADAQGTAAFIDTWPRIVGWALEAPEWAYPRQARFTLASTWRTLLGLEDPDQFLKLCNEHLPAWVPLFARWASDWLAERSCAVMFCRFLEAPEGGPLLTDGLTWLSAKVTPESLRYEREVGDSVGELLAILGRTRRQAVVGNPSTLKAYRDLLARLSDIQHPRAVEIEAILAHREAT